MPIETAVFNQAKILLPNEFVQLDDNKHDDAKDKNFYAKYCDPRFGVVDFANDKKYKLADYKAKFVEPHNKELKTKYGVGPYYKENLRYMFRHNVYSLQYQGCKDGNKYYAPNTITKIVLPTVDKSEGYALFCKSEPDNNFIAAYKVLPCVYFGKEYTFNSTFVYGHDYLQCFLDGEVKKLGCQYRKSKPIVLAGEKIMIDEETMLHCERFASGYFVTYNPPKCEDDLRNELSYGSVYEGSTGLYRCSGKSIGLARGTLKVTNCVYSGLFIPLNQCVHIGNGVYYRCLEDVYGQPQLDKRATYQDCRHEQRSEIAYSNGDFRADRSFYPTQQVLERSSLAPLLPKHKVFLSSRTEETIERYERIREKDYYLEDDYYEEIIIHHHHGKGRSKHNSTTFSSSSSGGSSSGEDQGSISQSSDEECDYEDVEGGRRETVDGEDGEEDSSSSQKTSDSTEEIIDETIIGGKGNGKGKGHGNHGYDDGYGRGGDREAKVYYTNSLQKRGNGGSRRTSHSSGGDDDNSHGKGHGSGSQGDREFHGSGSGGSHENGEPGDSGGESSTEGSHGGGKSNGDCDQVRSGGGEDDGGSHGNGHGSGSSSENDMHSHGRGSGGSHGNGEPARSGSSEDSHGGGKSSGDCDQVRGGGGGGGGGAGDDGDVPGTSGRDGSSSSESGGDGHSPDDDTIKPHGDDDISYCSGEGGGGSGAHGGGAGGDGSEYIDSHSHGDGKGGKGGGGDGSSSASHLNKPGHGHGAGGTSSESGENRGTPVILPPPQTSSGSEEHGHHKPPSGHPDSSSQQNPPKTSSSGNHESTKRPPASSSSHEKTKKPHPSSSSNHRTTKPSHAPHHTKSPDATTKRPCRSKPDPTCPMCKICKRKNNDGDDQQETRTRGSRTQTDQLEEKSSRSRKTEDDQVEETESEEQRRISGGQTITMEKIVMVNGKKVYHKTKTASNKWPNNGEGQAIDENSLKFSGETNVAGGVAGEKRIVIRTITKKHSTKKEKSQHKKKKSKYSKHTEVTE